MSILLNSIRYPLLINCSSNTSLHSRISLQSLRNISNSLLKGVFTHRTVNTLSPLAAAFNSKPSRFPTFSISRDSVGLFGLPELRDSNGFYVMQQQAVQEAEELVAEGCSPDRKRNMVEVFDELSNCLCRVADLSEFIRLAHPDSNYQYAAQDAAFTIGSLVEKLNVNRSLYDQLRGAVHRGDVCPTSEVDRHVAKLFLFDFEQSGIHLEEDKRNKVAQLNAGILALSQDFMANCQQPRKIARSLLPPNLRQQLNLTGDTVSVGSSFADSASEGTREAAYKVYQVPDQQQENLLRELLAARHTMATLCGFPSFAHRALGGSLAENPELVGSFLDDVTEQLRPLAQEDYDQMTRMNTINEERRVGVWDVAFYTSMARRAVLSRAGSNSSPDLLSHYFPLGAVMDGLNELLGRLYGVDMKLCEADPGELWVDDVHKLAVSDEGGQLLGHIYCDLTERAGKARQDCHFTIRGGKEMPGGEYQNPVVVVQMNLPPASWTAPPLLSPGMVENLFHEMGHALHSMLARTRYQHVTGTRCSTDFAEVPSILMEYFATDPRVLRTFARHYRTGESMPDHLIDIMLQSKAVFAASELQTQVLYSAVDQRYHSPVEWQHCTTSDLLKEEHDKHYGLPFVENTAWQLRFNHFVGYGGKYYAYLVSKAVASWIWQTYFLQDPFCRSAGQRYRAEVLQHGGGVPPRQLVAGYLGRDVTAGGMAAALMADLELRRGVARG